MTNISTQVFLIQTQLDAANARNDRLMKENAVLRGELERLTADEGSKASYNVEAKLRAFQMELERDRLHENLEHIKRKYNQLHEAFLQKLRRSKALEDVFCRQKTLTGLVMKAAIAQKEAEQKLKSEGKKSSKKDNDVVEALQNQVLALQKELMESHDIIDQMEFELESIDFLETENQRMQEELHFFKRQNLNLRKEDQQNLEAPPKYSELDGENSTCFRDSLASSLADSFAGDMDAETMERAALTDSLMKTIETESSFLRRDLLRSRLQRPRIPPKPTSRDN